MFDRIRPMIPTKLAFSPALVAAFGCLATIIALLTNNPGWAIIIASLVLPAATLVELSQRDLFEHESAWGAPAVLVWGALVGIVGGILASSISAKWWVSGATLHVGAGGFGGRAADLAGSPPFGVLLLNGIVIPALAVAFCAVGPFTLRRFPAFRNEVMDGVTLGFASGCGMATGMTMVFVWPIVGGSSTKGDTVADWTALVTGVLVTRPVIFGLAVSFVCAGIWHSTISQRTFDLILPAAIGLGGAMFFSVGDLLVQPTGTRKELLWHAVVAISMVLAARVFIHRVFTQDRATNAAMVNRVICSNCRASTPSGLFCASCGAALNPAPDVAEPEASINRVEVEEPSISLPDDSSEAMTPISGDPTSAG